MKSASSLVFAGALVWAASAGAQSSPHALPIEAYGKLPGIEDVELSPSGERYAFVTVDGAAREVLVADATNKLLAKADLGQIKVRGLDWAGNNFLLTTVSKTYNLGIDFGFRSEVFQVSVMNVPAQSSYWALAANGRSPGVWGWPDTAERGGRWFGYFPAITVDTEAGVEHVKKGAPDLYRVDLASGGALKVAEGPAEESDVRRDWYVGSTGEIEAQEDYEKGRGRWRLYSAHRDRVMVEAEDPLGYDRLLGAGRTPGTLLYWRGANKDDGDMFEIQATGEPRPRPLFQDRTRRELLFDPKTKLLLGATFRDSGSESDLFDPQLNAKVVGASKAFPGERMELTSWSTDLDRMVVYTDADNDSGTYWLVDIKTGKANEIGRPYPQVKDALVAPSRLFDYHAADGLALQGVLTLPPGRTAKALPVIVFPHGGPAAYDYVHFDWWAQAMASRGYAVFQPNFRGSTGYGAPLLHAGKGEWGRKMQTDISDGLKALATQGIVDPKRACIVGGSYGGYAALAGVTLQHGLYRCAVSVAGVADLPDMLAFETYRNGSGGDVLRYWSEFMGADLPASTLTAISPMRNAAAADAPILLIHGVEDTVVEPSQSQNMKLALDRAGKPVELVMLPGEDHWLSTEATRTAMLAALGKFLGKYDPPD